MSIPNHPVLKNLHLLKWPFHDQISDILSGEEYRECVPALRGDNLAWLVEYLDKVHPHVAPPHSPFNPAQVLERLDHSSDVSRKCRSELRSICGTAAILPKSYTILSRLTIDLKPVASGGHGDVYEGTLDGSRVCVKRTRVYTKDGPEKATKVC